MLNSGVIYTTLAEFLSRIGRLINSNIKSSWIVAEIARVNEDKSGHFWFELVERRESELIAKADAVVWAYNRRVVENFKDTTGIPIQEGMKILFYGKASFHERHGFKLIIEQIDPAFTLGEMALRRKEVLNRLSREGLIDRNKSFELPLVIQRIAVVSSFRAAGYEDFCRILIENTHGFSFKLTLFDAIVQGDSAVDSIVEALRKISMDYEKFDAVALIRGGGSVVDLQCFDEYELARAIALMPLPVLTGIGHTRDITVSDHVANRNFKTPSDLAKFIIDRALSFDTRIEDLRKSLARKVELFLSSEGSKLRNLEERILSSSNNSLYRLSSKVRLNASQISRLALISLGAEKDRVFRCKNRFTLLTQRRLNEQNQRIISLVRKLSLSSADRLSANRFFIKRASESLLQGARNSIRILTILLERNSEKLHLLSPESILRRGYSITYQNGKVLKDSRDAKVGSMIDVYLYRGRISGKVISREEEDGQPKLF